MKINWYIKFKFNSITSVIATIKNRKYTEKRPRLPFHGSCRNSVSHTKKKKKEKKGRVIWSFWCQRIRPLKLRLPDNVQGSMDNENYSKLTGIARYNARPQFPPWGAERRNGKRGAH